MQNNFNYIDILKIDEEGAEKKYLHLNLQILNVEKELIFFLKDMLLLLFVHVNLQFE